MEVPRRSRIRRTINSAMTFHQLRGWKPGAHQCVADLLEHSSIAITGDVYGHNSTTQREQRSTARRTRLVR